MGKAVAELLYVCRPSLRPAFNMRATRQPSNCGWLDQPTIYAHFLYMLAILVYIFQSLFIEVAFVACCVLWWAQGVHRVSGLFVLARSQVAIQILYLPLEIAHDIPLIMHYRMSL